MASPNSNLSPRQKMINLMYIVLTAMLALNVSSDVLNGFKQVEEGLVRSTGNSTVQNQALYNELSSFNQKNPEKTKEWYDKASEVKKRTQELYDYIADLKLRIVRQADGDDGNVFDIKHQDDLEAASRIMLAPARGEGKKLRQSLTEYSRVVSGMIPDTLQRKVISDYLTPRTPVSGVKNHKNWEEAMFENMPVAAAVTILSKIQSDIRYAEGEVLHTLLKNVDVGDVRVNRLNAFVIPNSKTIIRGGKYSADIVLAAIDTTQAPVIYIGDTKLPEEQKGKYEFICGKTGVFDFSGYLEVPHGDGTLTRHDFSSSYTVVEPTATVSATMMNVLYAGIDNPISISVPGVPMHSVSATMSNGSLTRSGDHWVARPARVGQDVTITVTAVLEGHSQVVNTTQFRVRQLPDPMPFIAYKDDKGYERRYKGGKPFPKSLLLSAPGIQAAIDDDLLNVTYRVLQFETVFFDSMGNAMPEISDGASFSERQRTAFRRLSRGKRFYISRVKAVGPDGIQRDLSPIEVIVN
ncbi:gliding motility protein GldM [Coprobacter secundus]|jgi:gliding motility-associated protein gldM|uniref:Gliding motility protein GldM n=1 Tax=Coprobacter secundus subsp. similis TaxID=2751153 RepID=A0A7G1I3G3_9BACT|nr:gliding motility protein GldM [Coprobacter secundus]BCI64087.1 gliding motility protein GldM [Coprobacter secundus subsp. similis]CCY37017.1 gliding motility-associated protein GldM [Tannerella sp. CAG:118]